MSIFGSRDKQKISSLEREIEKKDRRIRQLESLCAEKDEYFLGAISDGLRHGSPEAARQELEQRFQRKYPEAARHMADRKKYLHGK